MKASFKCFNSASSNNTVWEGVPVINAPDAEESASTLSRGVWLGQPESVASGGSDWGDSK